MGARDQLAAGARQDGFRSFKPACVGSRPTGGTTVWVTNFDGEAPVLTRRERGSSPRWPTDATGASKRRQ